MKRVNLALAAALVATSFAPRSAHASGLYDGAVVIVGIPALQWRDVTATGTPALWRLAGTAAVGSLSVRATADLAQAGTAPADGWATLSAGNRATGRIPDADPTAVPVLPAAMTQLRARNDELPFDAEVGALGTALVRLGVRRIAVGRGAALALADERGDPGEVFDLPSEPADLGAPLGRMVAEPTPAVVAVEMPQLVGGTTPAALGEIDALIGAIVGQLSPRDHLFIAGLSDRVGEPSHLRVAIARSTEYPSGALRSATTRRDGFVQLIDLAPTVLRLRSSRAESPMVGRPWTSTADDSSVAARVARLVDADRAAAGYRRYVPQFFLVLVLAQLLLYGGTWLAVRRSAAGSGRRAAALTLARQFALAFAAVPAATYLAHLTPWWRHPIGYLICVVAAIVGGLYLVAARGPWRRRPLGPEAVVAGATFAVIAADLLTGARLQLSSVAGYSPVVAGRFAGIGNVAFAVFAASALLFAAALCAGLTSRRTAVAAVAAVGIVAVVVDGSPQWGSDFGGVLALVPGFAVLGLLVSGRRLSWRIVVGVAAAAVAAVTAFALLDYARPADSQSHLGRFVGQLLDGGAGTVVRRKASANMRLLRTSVLTLLVPLAVLFVSFVLLRPAGGLRRAFAALPELRAGLLAVLTMAVAGFATNDSGVAVPAVAATIAVPLAIAVAMQYADSPDTPGPEQDEAPSVLP